MEARPPKAVQTGELQKELEDIEKEIEEAEKKDEQKREWIAKKFEEVRKQRIAICTGILETQARANVIAEQLAERASTAPAATISPAPEQAAPQLQLTQVPAFLSQQKAELDSTCSSGTQLSDPTKEMLKQLSDQWSFFEKVGALLVSAQTAVNAEVNYAAGFVSTDMPPSQLDIASGCSLERTTSAVGQQPPTQHTLLEPPVPLPVPKGFANTVPPPIDERELFEVGDRDEEMDNDAQGKADWDSQIDSFQTVMAMARASATQAQATN